MPLATPLKVAVSSCLLGLEVRFDGGHKRDSFVADTLAEHFELVPVCPEVGIGLGTPREPIRLEGAVGSPRLVSIGGRVDLTERMRRWAERETARLARLDLCGYVFKKDSPSCGLFRVRVYSPAGRPSHDGRGAFARVLTEALPLLPVEEEGRLRDARLRESFVERVFAYRRVTDLFARGWKLGDLVAFHAREKLLLLAHEAAGYRELGRVVAGAKGVDRAELAARYREGFMRTLAVAATTRKHVNVLQHMAGYFKRDLDATDRAELHEVITEYRRGLTPLVVPLTLLRHHLRRHPVPYLEAQSYLEPHPRELMLRNHV
jgi:uncharacterized protein YbgA (DUF1722 family)/uncharacterized protein YbbK (DUF523 family)